jgi:hypothetical protein
MGSTENPCLLAFVFSQDEKTQECNVHAVAENDVENRKGGNQHERDAIPVRRDVFGLNGQEEETHRSAEDVADSVNGGVFGEAFDALKHGLLHSD